MVMTKSIRLSDLLGIIRGDMADIRGDPDRLVACAMPFDQAGAEAVTFADMPATLKRVKDSRAGAVIVPRQFSGPAGTDLIFSDHPRLAFARVMNYFYPRLRAFSGIDAKAVIGEHFCCGPDPAIAPLAFIGDHVTLGARVTVHPHVYIGNGVHIGDDTEILPNVSIMENCKIGSRVIIGPATVIGADGFGYVRDEAGHLKIPQTGIVQVDDDVEIGAANTIDRATFGRTRICRGVKTDNQVHIGHNVTIGENSIIVAQVGVAGSTTVGRDVTVAGQAGIGGHITIGDGAVIGPKAGVTRSVEPGRTVSGTPEMPHRHWLRVQRLIARLPEMKKQVEDLARRLEAVEKKNKKHDMEEKRDDSSDSDH